MNSGREGQNLYGRYECDNDVLMGFISLSPRQQQCLLEVPLAVYRGLLCPRAVLEGKTALRLERLNFHKDFGI